LPASRRSGLRSDEATLAIFLERDAKRRAREAARARKGNAKSADPGLARLLTKSSQKAAALKSSGKDVKAEALASVKAASGNPATEKPASPKRASKAARPATKKIARVRSPTAVAIG
jgi:DNA topoisomerase-1